MYQITTVYNHRAMTVLCRAIRKTYRRRLSLAMRILGGVFIAVEAVFMGLLYWLGAFVWDVAAVLSILMAVLLLLLIFFNDQINAWIGGGMTYGFGQETTAELDGEAYTVTLAGAAGRWQYDRIQRLCETKDYFVFLLDKRHGQIFDKSGFTEGTPEAFREFIQAKTGLTVQFVK